MSLKVCLCLVLLLDDLVLAMSVLCTWFQNFVTLMNFVCVYFLIKNTHNVRYFMLIW